MRFTFIILIFPILFYRQSAAAQLRGDITGPSTIPLQSTVTLTHDMQGGVWSSSSPSIALVRDSATGVVEGINSGIATITYAVDGHTLVKPVTVSQTGTFLPGTNLCDTAPWQLVFYDEFNGYTDGSGHHSNALDLSKWYIEDGIPYGSGPVHVMKNANCIVGGGICTLSAYHGAFTYTDYSGVSGPASISAGHINSWQKFSYGKFEARIWFPAFEYAHSNFELNSRDYGPGYWHYAVDIAEAYGRPYMGAGKGAYNQRVTRSLHRWIDGAAGYDPRETSWKYPHQEDIDKVWGSYLNLMESWHTFTFEWDEHFVKFSWDGGTPLVHGREYFRRPRKWTNNKDCLVSGVFKTDPAFPLDEPELTDALQVLLHCDVDRDIYNDTTERLLGNMLVDYVRVWQKQPDYKHHNLCDRKISGPAAICDESEYTYRITGAGALTTGARWHWSASSNIEIVMPGINEIKVKRNAITEPAWIKFTDDNPQCPTVAYALRLDCP